jgi:hypothetical protein
MVIVGYREKSRGDVEETGDGYSYLVLPRKAYWEFQGQHTNQACYKSGIMPQNARGV